MFESAAGRTLLLGIDTSSEGDLALVRLHADGQLEQLGSRQFSGRHQSTELLPRLRSLLHEAGAALADVAAIIIVRGPGSFTGLRIGMSAAKGLAEAAAIPLIAVSSMEVLSRGSKKDTVVIAIAGRTEYYVRVQPQDGDAPIETLETDASLRSLAQGRTVVVSDAKIADRFPQAASVTVGQAGAWQAILTALPRFIAGDFDDASTLDANYVRRPYTETAKQTQ